MVKTSTSLKFNDVTLEIMIQCNQNNILFIKFSCMLMQFYHSSYIKSPTSSKLIRKKYIILNVDPPQNHQRLVVLWVMASGAGRGQSGGIGGPRMASAQCRFSCKIKSW
jgi:hypothetical protein